MALVGYARVSSTGQTLDVQRQKLQHCDKLFEEKRSGLSHARPQLNACMDYLREGDTLVVTRLDRLARSTLHLCQIAEQLHKQDVHLRVIDQNIETDSATGRLLFNMLAAIAQFETELRAERQRDGIDQAKARGVQFGQKPKLTDLQVVEMKRMREDGALIRELMDEFELSKSSVYRYLREGVSVEFSKHSV